MLFPCFFFPPLSLKLPTIKKLHILFFFLLSLFLLCFLHRKPTYTNTKKLHRNKAMSAFGSLHHIFENNQLPENPTLLESLSWSQIKQVKSIDTSSFTEIFGELHFKESPQPSPSISSPSNSSPTPTPHVCASSFSGIIDHNNNNLSQKKDVFSDTPITNHTKNNTTHKRSESLQLCTEGLGFESSDDVEDLKASSGVNNELCWQIQSDGNEIDAKKCVTRSRVNNNEGEYPPPISCIGKSTGKPRVSFRSYRKNGRFVLKEIMIPTQELLHAHREDGRLKLHFVQPHEEFQEKDDDNDEDNEEDEEEYCDDVQGVDEGKETEMLF